MPEAIFAIGPDKGKDLRQLRPYFVMQLETSAGPGGEAPITRNSTAYQSQLRRVVDYVDGVVDEAERILLVPEDLIENNRGNLVATLRKAALAVSQAASADGSAASPTDAPTWLCRLFSWRLIRALADSNGNSIDRRLIASLTNELNGILSEGCLFEPSLLPATDSAGSALTWPVEFDKALSPRSGDLHRILRRELRAVFGQTANPTGDQLLTLMGGADRDEKFTGRSRLLINRLILSLAFPGAIAPLIRKKDITDIFILSHGWHRNFFAAIAAYDQIISRFSLLMRRERLTYEPPFHPLFLALHWNSDPSQDGWVDAQGRRDKMSFLQRIEVTFDRPPASEEAAIEPRSRFLNVFEDIFQHFSQLSAPNTTALSDETTLETTILAERLYRFSLRDAPGATEAEKVCAAWTCYFRSQAKGFLSGQESEPVRFLSAGQAYKNLGLFLLGAFGTAVLIGPARPICDWIAKGISHLSIIFSVIIAKHIGLFPDKLCYAVEVALYLLLFYTLVAFCYAYLNAAAAVPEAKRPNRLVPLSYLLAWFPVQLFRAGPWLWYLFGTYLNPKRGKKVEYKSLFPERIGKRDKDIAPSEVAAFSSDAKKNRRYRLAQWSRHAVELFTRTLGPSLRIQGNSVVTAIDNQMAFWDMQIRGTQAGSTAAQVIADLLNEQSVEPASRHLATAKIHLLGHSFGGLVILNALRHLVLDEQIDSEFRPNRISPERQNAGERPRDRKVQSVCLLEAAVASSWFEEEIQLQNQIQGAIGCIYSAYDTANGFFYPVANNGRCAAGYVGLSHPDPAYMRLPTDTSLGAFLLSSIVSSPDLLTAISPDPQAVTEAIAAARAAEKSPKDIGADARAAAIHSLLTATPPKSRPLIVNLDASRIIYEGSKALGGGHGDIFKDDVTNLCWAVTRLELPEAEEQVPTGSA